MATCTLSRRDPQKGKRGFSTLKGFTAIELMIALAVVAIVASIAFPTFIEQNEKHQVVDGAEQLQTFLGEIRSLAVALDMYRLDNFVYPSTEQGLDALVTRPAGFPEPKNYSPDGYLKSVPTDPWGSPYVYERSGDSFSLFSLGADGAEGGDALNADIRYEDL